MKFKIISIGKIKNKNILFEIEELKKRISRLEIIELKEIKEKNTEILKNKEFELILNIIKKEDLNILMWENGIEFTTKEFYNKFKLEDRTICFIITGAFGANKKLHNLVDLKISLSKMTFTHEQAYYMLIEQIYRAECYKNNIEYTK